MDTTDGFTDLPTIYADLAGDPLADSNQISPQQYDQFFEEWRKSAEWNCLVANCRRSKNVSPVEPSLLLPFDAIAQEYRKGHADSQHEGRCRAIADSIGELVWMLISVFSVLPILEVATPMKALKTADLDQFAQPWISVYIPTCSVYFVSVEQKQSAVKAVGDWEKVGWIDELHVAAYGDCSLPIDLDAYKSWLAYEQIHDLLKLPAYLSHREYFTKHRGEIVAGYAAQTDGSWQFIALNGLSRGKDKDRIERLFTNPAFKNAVHANVQVFRPWFIQREADAQELSCLGEDGAHLEARMNHLRCIGGFKSDYGVTLTHNLVNQPFGNLDCTRDTASTFTNLLIAVPPQSEEKIQLKLIKKLDPPNSKLVPSDLGQDTRRSRMQEELVRVVRILWDNVDILKLPTSRQMMLEAEQALDAELEKTKRYEYMYRDIQKPLDALLELSQNLTNTAGRLSMARGDHLQSLLANRHRLAMLFEEGYSNPRYGNLHLAKHDATEYVSYDMMAANLLVAIAALENDESFDVRSGQSAMTDRLKNKLERLVHSLNEPKDTKERDSHRRKVAPLSIFAPRTMWHAARSAAAYDAACSIVRRLHSQWSAVSFEVYDKRPDPEKVDQTELALSSLKRRVHSNFKPSSIALNVKGDLAKKTATLDDLACFMDPNFTVRSLPSLEDEDNLHGLALFHQASFPFRSVGELFTAIQAFFKSKEVSEGTLAFSSEAKSRTLEISVSSMYKAATGDTSQATILSGSATNLARLLNEFKNPDDRSSSLILGDFLAPVVALIQSRIACEDSVGRTSDSLLDISPTADNRNVVLKFRRRPDTQFVWTIGEYTLTFVSTQS